MDDAANPTPTSSSSSAAAAAAAAAAQHQQLQRQIFLMQQAQAQSQSQGHAPTPQQLSQQAMSFFPSNIDAHLPLPGPIRFQQPLPQQPPPPQQQIHSWGPSLLQSWASLQQQQQAAVAAVARVQSPEVEMALQDVMQVCNPDIKTPFQSIEDAVNRWGTVSKFFPFSSIIHDIAYNLDQYGFACLAEIRVFLFFTCTDSSISIRDEFVAYSCLFGLFAVSGVPIDD